MSVDGRWEHNEVFAERLRALLEERDMSLADLARALHVDRATVTRYAQGRVPPVPTLRVICDMFGVSLDFMLGRTDHPRGGMATAPEAVPDDELYIVWRGRPQNLPPEYKRVLIDLIEAANRRLREEQESKT